MITTRRFSFGLLSSKVRMSDLSRVRPIKGDLVARADKEKASWICESVARFCGSFARRLSTNSAYELGKSVTMDKRLGDAYRYLARRLARSKSSKGSLLQNAR